jgi:hypothetical protein
MRLRYVVICEREVNCADEHKLEIINYEKVMVINAIARNQYLAGEKFQVIVDEIIPT